MKPRIEVLFVGQAPGSDPEVREALAGRTGENLAALLRLKLRTFIRRHPRANLNQTFPGKKAKGDGFDFAAGWIAARRIVAVKPRRIVCLGQVVARCFELPPRPLRVTVLGGIRYLQIPHPSGINLWYNNPRNRAAAKRALAAFLR